MAGALKKVKFAKYPSILGLVYLNDIAKCVKKITVKAFRPKRGVAKLGLMATWQTVSPKAKPGKTTFTEAGEGHTLSISAYVMIQGQDLHTMRCESDYKAERLPIRNRPSLLC